jgi:hypothetical protein
MFLNILFGGKNGENSRVARLNKDYLNNGQIKDKDQIEQLSYQMLMDDMDLIRAKI